MRRLALLILLALAGPATAADLLVGASWSNFQEERWKTDEAALRAALAELGAGYVSADAQSSTEKQLADVESLLARGVDALVIVAQDADAIGPAVRAAVAEGVPVIAYDRLIEAPDAFYISFDNREVGRIQAREVQRVRPSGRYVFIKGSPQDPNSDFVHAGQRDVLAPAIASGGIVVVGDQYVDGWLPEIAQKTMEQILTANDNGVDAVVCSNDAMAGAVLAALHEQGLDDVPVSGQDGDHAALNRVARGVQTVSVWKDARELGRTAARVAVALARGDAPGKISGAQRYQGGARAVELDAILLEPLPITRENLQTVIDAAWISKASLCRGVNDAPPPACR
jgi:D-xylose transport system substrate-binding protein